ncbi:hypothetical protein BDP81DRAFT_419388 [Colletotrichum phormii]|uniref:Uncharacterized protein n=1 Tax=Colletotrichum phormii TaxID=359342 RepID=A0AAJ0EIA5_9PEZI|nr:uncharacterized protein BDP81DRAFT_419388 [Colletotrichum phormii]KAK1640118.1 hypothetical protein BDP81DRAFT_419388 [Colletotrichum phormii]
MASHTLHTIPVSKSHINKGEADKMSEFLIRQKPCNEENHRRCETSCGRGPVCRQTRSSPCT